MLRWFLRRREGELGSQPSLGGRTPAVPSGTRLYVIGDVHGSIGLLQELEQIILEDVARSPKIVRLVAVYLGDYIDRGPSSRAVIDHLIRNPLPDFNRVFLMGNHDLWFRDFLEGFPVGEVWLDNGGEATLASYGVELDPFLSPEDRLDHARRQLLAQIPQHHQTFLERLELAFGMGDYFFCHAGVRPGIPLEAQNPVDLLWIREPFLSYPGEFGKIVVHGHTPQNEPVVRHNRIGIDTGACWTGRLTCLVLEGTEHRFLATGANTGG